MPCPSNPTEPIGGLGDMIAKIIAEINTPSGQVGPLSQAYGRGAGAAWHMLLGAVVAIPMGDLKWLYGLGVAVLYWIAKEAGDLRRGGRFWDGIEDAACVYLGTFCGPLWWPIVALASTGYVFVMGARSGP